MTIKSFLKLVEIQTKIASMFPFIFATVFSLYRYGSLNLLNTALMFVSLLFFDMTTTSINNYMDYKKAVDQDYRDNHNIIGMASIPLHTVRFIILSMLGIAIIAGILLTIKTGWIVLILGVFSFFVGIFYTFGPIPISRMPLGEILSGFMMGFVIVFIAVYIHSPSMAVVTVKEGHLFLNLDLKEFLSIALISAPFVLLISNLMLANNICDLEQDVKNDRFLLPYYLGVKNALTIYRLSYYGAYLIIIASVALGILPLFSLLSLISFPVVQKHIVLFEKKQLKAETFVLSVKNLTILSAAYILTLLPALFF